MKKNIALAVWFLFLAVSPVFALWDPFVKIQLAINNLEQKLQTVKMIEQIRVMTSSYKTAVMLKEQAEANYKKLQDPKQWDRMKQYALERLGNVKDRMEGDPYDSPLYTMMQDFERGLDDYIVAYSRADEALNWIDRMDEKAYSSLKSAPGIGTLASWDEWGTSWSADFRDRAHFKRYYKDEVKKTLRAVEREVDEATRRFVELDGNWKTVGEREQKLRAAITQAMECMMDARADIERSGKSTELAAAQSKFNQCKNEYDFLLSQMAELQKEKEILEKLKGPAYSYVKDATKRLNDLADLIQFQGDMNTKAVTFLLLNSQAHMADTVQKIMGIFYPLLLATFAIGILWFGISTYKGVESSVALPVLAGFLFALFTTAEWSPFALHKMAGFVGVIGDTITLQFRNGVENPIELVRNMSAVWIKEVVIDFKMSGSVEGMIGELISAIISAVSFIANKAIAFVLGTLSWVLLALAFLFRNLIFWVLMCLGPAVISLAPIAWGRKVLYRWGEAVFAALLMGPIILIFMAVMNGFLAGGAYDPTSYGGFATLGKVLVGVFQGVVMLLGLLLSPVVSFMIAKGGFDAVAGKGVAAGGTALKAGAGLLPMAFGGGMALAGSGLKGALGGGGFKGLGGMISGAGNFAEEKGFSGIGGALNSVGNKFSGAGDKIAQSWAGREVNAAGDWLKNNGTAIKTGKAAAAGVKFSSRQLRNHFEKNFFG